MSVPQCQLQAHMLGIYREGGGTTRPLYPPTRIESGMVLEHYLAWDVSIQLLKRAYIITRVGRKIDGAHKLG